MISPGLVENLPSLLVEHVSVIPHGGVKENRRHFYHTSAFR